MKIKRVGIAVGQLFLLVIGYFVISIISGMLSGSDKIFDLTKEQQMAAAMGILYVSLCFSVLTLYLCKRINQYGIKLFSTIFTLIFGIFVFLTQIESLVFLEQFSNILPKGVLPVLVFDTSINTFLFSFMAVLISGKWKKQTILPKRYNIPLQELIIKVVILSIVYYITYILFGSYVLLPLAGDAFNSYYGDLHLPSWFFLLQIFRGAIWVIITLPIVLNFKGSIHEMAVAVALSFSLFMGINLLVPSPLMPTEIRMAHFIEVISSNFIFGIIVTYVLCFKFPKKKLKKRIAPV